MPLGGESTVHDSGTLQMRADDGSAWVVQANGADGDDLAASNLPGAIGWRGTDPSIIERLQALTP